jgi:hypothetical protein
VTSFLHQFSYRPRLAQVGARYDYIKSNIDGFYPARVFVYVADPEHLEVLKFEAHGMDAAYVKAHMDWRTFSADSLDSWVLTPDGNSRRQALLSSSFEEKTFTISWQERENKIRVEHYPAHVYNFDLISLNYSLRHWIEPEGELTVGILQPDFDPNPQTLLKYKGKVVIQYQGQEERNRQPCRKYKIGGAGFRGRIGTIWQHREQLHVEDIEIPVADHPDWKTFKFNLIARADMDAQQWVEFKSSEISKLKQQ